MKSWYQPKKWLKSVAVSVAKANVNSSRLRPRSDGDERRELALVRSVPRVMGFIGGTSDRPAPISDKEVDAIMNRLQQVGDKPRPKTLFEPGEMVRVNDGPFADFNGVVEEVDYEKSRLKVSVSIFGRATPVELDFSRLKKPNPAIKSGDLIVAQGARLEYNFAPFVLWALPVKRFLYHGSLSEALLPNLRNL